MWKKVLKVIGIDRSNAMMRVEACDIGEPVPRSDGAERWSDEDIAAALAARGLVRTLVPNVRTLDALKGPYSTVEEAVEAFSRQWPGVLSINTWSPLFAADRQNWRDSFLHDPESRAGWTVETCEVQPACTTQDASSSPTHELTWWELKEKFPAHVQAMEYRLTSQHVPPIPPQELETKACAVSSDILETARTRPHPIVGTHVEDL